MQADQQLAQNKMASGNTDTMGGRYRALEQNESPMDYGPGDNKHVGNGFGLHEQKAKNVEAHEWEKLERGIILPLKGLKCVKSSASSSTERREEEKALIGEGATRKTDNLHGRESEGGKSGPSTSRGLSESMDRGATAMDIQLPDNAKSPMGGTNPPKTSRSLPTTLRSGTTRDPAMDPSPTGHSTSIRSRSPLTKGRVHNLCDSTTTDVQGSVSPKNVESFDSGSIERWNLPAADPSGEHQIH